VPDMVMPLSMRVNKKNQLTLHGPGLWSGWRKQSAISVPGQWDKCKNQQLDLVPSSGV
jgi:hypothetical protein